MGAKKTSRSGGSRYETLTVGRYLATLSGRKVFVILLITLALAACAEREPIYIGAILSLSGPAANAGPSVRDGLLLAVEEINEQGGIGGRKVEVIVEDGTADPARAREAFLEVEKQYRPLFFVSTTSSMAHALAPLAESSEVVLVALIATSPTLTDDSAWVFRYFTSPKTEIEAAATIVRRLNPHVLGILYLDDEYGRPVYSALAEVAQWEDREVVGVGYSATEADFSQETAMVSRASAVYVVGFQSHAAAVVKQLRRQGYDDRIILSAVVDDKFAASLPELTGAYIASFAMYNPNFPLAKGVADTYKHAYDRAFDHYAANGYSAVRIAYELLRGQAVSRNALRTALEGGFVYPGVLGPIAVAPGDHDLEIALHPARISDGRIVF
jgi:ABC-type branched-subunit amino acid transport system substrate-binding protein